MTRSFKCPIQTSARFHDGDAAVMTPQETISYRDFNAIIEAAAAALTREGVTAGDYVGIMSLPTLNYVTTLWALWRIGAVACPLNPQWPAQRWTTALEETPARRILCAADRLESVGTVAGDRFAVTAFDENALPAEDHPPADTGAIDGERPASVVMTSGSQGRPKPAQLSFANHYLSAVGSNEHIPLVPGERWLLSLPLYHVSGLSILFRCAVAAAAVVLPDPQADLAANIKRFLPTHVSMVPTQLQRIIQTSTADPDAGISSLKSLKAVLLGGAPIPPELLRCSLDAGLPLYATYGLTETASQLITVSYRPAKGTAKKTTRDAEPPDALPGWEAISWTMPFAQTRLDVDGEALVRGDILFQGYWKKKNLTRPLDEHGWFHTGDIADSDVHHVFHVCGRKDAMFISGGENIHPEEIETALLSLPGVIAAVVVGEKDDEFGHRPVAFVSMADGSPPDAKHLTEELRPVLPPYALPASYRAWPADLEPGLKPSRQTFLRAVVKDSRPPNQSRGDL